MIWTINKKISINKINIKTRIVINPKIKFQKYIKLKIRIILKIINMIIPNYNKISIKIIIIIIMTRIFIKPKIIIQINNKFNLIINPKIRIIKIKIIIIK